MKPPKTTFVYTNPNQLDGDVFQVAAAACRQAQNVAVLLVEALDDAFRMARAAEMERELIATDSCDGKAFEQTPLGSKLAMLQHRAEGTREALTPAGAAASYDPKNPPKEAK